MSRHTDLFLKSTIAISCFYTMMELLLVERLILCTYKWKNSQTPGDRRHWICSSESLCRDSNQGLFYSLPQFSPGHCVRWWRSTAFSLATQSTEMRMRPRPLAASFNTGPSTPTWTVCITTTATETVSITTATPSPATLPQWAGYHIMTKTGIDVTDWRTLYQTLDYGNAAHSGHISDVQTGQFVLLLCGI